VKIKLPPKKAEVCALPSSLALRAFAA